MNEVLTQDGSLGDRDNSLRLEDAGPILGHVKHFACDVIILIRHGLLLVGEYVACFSCGRVNSPRDHVLGRRWTDLPQALKIARHGGYRGASHTFTCLRPLLRPLRTYRLLVSIENRTKFLNSSCIGNAFSSGKKCICVRLVMTRD